MKLFFPNQTSANLLVSYAKEKYTTDESNKNIERFTIIYDVFIKARSYSIINKIFFFLALAFGLLVLLWPSLAIFGKDFGWEKGFLNSAIVQTTVTAIAALTFAIYSHYKKRQVSAENLLRFAIFSEDTLKEIKDLVITEMVSIDSGFSFGRNVIKGGELGDGKEGKSL